MDSENVQIFVEIIGEICGNLDTFFQSDLTNGIAPRDMRRLSMEFRRCLKNRNGLCIYLGNQYMSGLGQWKYQKRWCWSVSLLMPQLNKVAPTDTWELIRNLVEQNHDKIPLTDEDKEEVSCCDWKHFQDWKERKNQGDQLQRGNGRTTFMLEGVHYRRQAVKMRGHPQ